jgi:hypothetical protein
MKKGSAVRLIRNLVTAVMVGEIGTHCVELDRLEARFSNEYLDFLSVATATGIGAPCIEFRDPHGRRVRRAHIAFRRPVFPGGQSSISEAPATGASRKPRNA